jgi:hypothetical protein
MKAFLPTLTLLAISSAMAGDVVLPTPDQLEMSVCVGGYLTKDYKVISVDGNTGYQYGVVFEQDRCTVHSGRVTSTGYHSTCADVVWDGNGLLQSIQVSGSYAGRIAQTIASCQ